MHMASSNSAAFYLSSRLCLRQVVNGSSAKCIASPTRPTLFRSAHVYQTAARFYSGWRWIQYQHNGWQKFRTGRATDISAARALTSSTTRRNPSHCVKDFEPNSFQVEFYRKNGYVVIPDVLSEAHLSIWRDVIDSAVAQRGPDWVYPKKNQADATNVELDFYTKVFTQRINLWQSDSHVRDLIMSAAQVLVRAACRLEDISALRLWHDQALYKEPWANATSWHVDVPYWSFDSEHAISIWVALDDATLSNGCMHFIPGSHELVRADYRRNGHFKEIKIGKNMSDVFDSFPAARAMDSSAVPMTAGSVSFHSGMLIHGAGCNMTPRRRRAMTLQLMPDGSRFNGKQNILTEEQFAALRIGEVMDSDDQNPLLFRDVK